jgi:hypothetical protein
MDVERDTVMFFAAKRNVRTTYRRDRSGRPKRLLHQYLIKGALLLGSLIVGFSAVLAFHKRSQLREGPTPRPARMLVAHEVDSVDDIETNEPLVDAALSREAEAPIEVPPGRTPKGVRVSGTPLYLRCWDSKGEPRAGKNCDSLRVLEKRFANRLYVVDRCKRRHSGEEATGVLSLGVNIDFEKRAISFWSGPSSEIEKARKIGTCIRRDLAGLPLHDIHHEHDRYRLFFSVRFEGPERQQEEREPGKSVEVTKDHVRVRRRPEDGYVLGKISSGHRVTLIDREDDWCRVITPNRYRGWMICDALAL